jgi:hypothetical protein
MGKGYCDEKNDEGGYDRYPCDCRYDKDGKLKPVDEDV